MAEHELDFERPILELERKVKDLETFSKTASVGIEEEIEILKARCVALMRETFASLTPWQRVQLARHPERPQTIDYVNLMLDEFVELHGDRMYGDDRAVRCGLAKLGGEEVVFMGTEKGKSMKEKMECHFGCAHPEGYRKARRVMKLAEKFHLPVVALIDTPGAYPGLGAEERGQAWAIAENLRVMADLATIVISAVISEGGSGGALALAVADRLLILENAYLSVISPEGCAAILWKDGAKAPEAAEALKLTASNLLELGLVREIVPEPPGGAHRNHREMADTLKEVILRHLHELKGTPTEALLDARYENLRKVGVFLEPPPKNGSPL